MTGISKSDTRKTFEAILEVISAEMQKNEKVIILGFGTFSVKDKAARMSIHPQTMQPLELPAKKVVRFKPSQYLNNLLVLKKKRGRPRIEKGAEQ
ncbi:DNA-binding protein HU-beta [Dysgonomonas hofstadii]|uniref:DNA-binding protein HU-beta n=2 Tax=Dysgonomonas hofstadii TaxID=637886 RepID=A0A840CL39_9BACT|nr:DNA-binding protein HU-beta [Dysgonomonas hofstadii]